MVGIIFYIINIRELELLILIFYVYNFGFILNWLIIFNCFIFRIFFIIKVINLIIVIILK